MDKNCKDFKNGNEMSYLKKRLTYMYNLYVFMCKTILYRHLIINYGLNFFKIIILKINNQFIIYCEL